MQLIHSKYSFTVLLTFIVGLLTNQGIAQRNVTEAIGTPYVSIQYGLQWPSGDFKERYGLTNSIGSHAGYKTKHNWIYGLEGNFFFGNQIHIEGLLQNLMDEHGQITNTSGGPATVTFFNRGFNVNVSIGKIFPIWSPNPNSGPMIRVTAGYRWTKLRIATIDDEVPQLEGDYKKGYDRLEIGLNTSQFIGYNFMANRGLYNFYAGAYFQQMFTKDQRSIYWDHPNRLVNKDLRISYFFGFQVGWLIPIYKRQPKKFYYN